MNPSSPERRRVEPAAGVRSVPRTIVSGALLLVGLIVVTVAVVLLVRRVPPPSDAGVVPEASTAAGAVPGMTAGADAGVTAVVTTGRSATGSARPARPGVQPHGPPSHGPTAGRSTSPTVGVGPAPVPTLLRLPSLGVTASISPVTSSGGVLAVPQDPSTVGWWSSSARPGAPIGSTVIDGHIDSAATGPGALFHLSDLGPGDPVQLLTSAGATVRYTVRARRVYVKAGGLPAEVFAQTGTPRLILISCGGPFDSAARSYEDNIVIYATPGA